MPSKSRTVAKENPPPNGISQDLVAERAVLAFLQMGGGWPDGLTAEDFCRDTHKTIFVALEGIEAAGEARERASLLIELKQRRKLATVGGPSYLLKLDTETGIGPDADITRYVRRLHQYRDRRKEQAIGHALMSAAGDPGKLAAEAREQLTQINIESLEPRIALVNSLAVFPGKIRFESFSRRRPMVAAAVPERELTS